MVFSRFFKGKGKDGGGGDDGGDSPGSDAFKADPRKARRFFEHAQTVSEARNYDYAVDLYISGLKHDPDNMNQHEALYEVAKRRKVAGGKPPGMGERLKSGGPTPVDKMLHAEKLWAMDPLNVDHMLDVMKHAVDADKQYDEINLAEVAYWVGGLALDFNAQQKNDAKKFIKARDLFVEIRGFDKAVEACRRALAQSPNDSDLLQSLKELEAEHYTTSKTGTDGTAEAGGFRRFVKDADKQRALEQEDTISKTANQADEIIARRRAEYEEDPQDLDRVQKLVEALVSRETPETEKEAIDLLRQAWEESGQYRYKVRIGDITMKQMSRQIRQLTAQLQKSPEDKETEQRLKEAKRKQLEFELKEYTERTKNYPTDMGLRFELGKRYFQAGQTDEAIGAFQQAKADPKQRGGSHMYLGVCYVNKGWLDEAIETLQQGVDAHPSDNDKLGLDMRYLLMDARYKAAEKNGDIEQAREAQKMASQILQTNINFRDIKQRMDQIRALVDKLQNSAAPG